MKLAEIIKQKTVADITLTDGTVIAINQAGTLYRLEVLDDEAQQLEFGTLAQAGRHKGSRAKLVVPYASIRSLVIFY